MNTKRTFPLVVLLGTAAVAAGLGRVLDAEPQAEAFEELSLVFEGNANEEDGEVVLHAETREPIQQLVLLDPYGRPVHGLDAAGGALGVSELRLESGETELDAVRAAYPEGRYTVHARTADGKVRMGAVGLSHELPARVRFLSPADGAVLDRAEVVVRWTADARTVRHTVEIEDEFDEQRLVVTPQPGEHTLHVPAAVLAPDTEYQVVLVSHNAAGNRVVQELHFRTAP